MSKVLSVRLDDDLYTKCKQHKLEPKTLISEALESYLGGCIQPVYSEKNIENDDDVYSQIYGNFYKQEVIPLKKEIDHLSEINVILQVDKDYFKQQISALMLAKMPLLARIKLKLLNK